MSTTALQMDQQTAMMAINKTPQVHKHMNAEQARKVAEDYESFFLAQAFQPMFESIQAEEPFGGGHAEKMWMGMQVQEYGKQVAKAGGIGIADAVFREIMKMQEVQ